MIRPGLILIAATLLAGCVATQPTFAPGTTEIAAQRIRFLAEAVCLNHKSASAQARAARGIGFPLVRRNGPATEYINPGTLTFLRIGPVPPQATRTPSGEEITFGGTGCSVGSPAVPIREANRLAGEILAPRMVDGRDQLSAPVGAGTNADGGVGLFFDDLAVTLPTAQTTFINPATGEGRSFDHPVILVIHR